MFQPQIKNIFSSQRLTQNVILRLFLTFLIVIISTKSISFTIAMENNTEKSRWEHYVDLDNHIRNCPAMKHKIPPYIVGEEELQVYFDPFQIRTIDEVSQTVEMSALLVFFWYLPDCAWDSANFSDIWQIEIDSSAVWTPIITIPKSASEATVELPNKLEVSNTGLVQAFVPSSMSVYCYMDLNRYPFDDHNCSVVFLETSEMHISTVEEPFTLDNMSLKQFFGTSAEWELLSNDCQQSDVSGTQGGKYVECWFHIKRRSLFYIATIIFPIALLSIMTLVVFCIPAESGEKMSFVVAIFVSMTVFINFLVDVIPRSMDELPRIIELIMTVMVTIGLTALAAAIVLKKYRMEEKEKTKGGLRKRCNHLSNEKNDTTQNQRDNPPAFTDTDEYAIKARKPNDVVPFNNLRDEPDFSDQNGHLEANQRGPNNNEVMKSYGGSQSFENWGSTTQFHKATEKNARFSLWKNGFDRLTHTQLDKMFFLFFLIINTLLYSLVLIM